MLVDLIERGERIQEMRPAATLSTEGAAHQFASEFVKIAVPPIFIGPRITRRQIQCERQGRPLDFRLGRIKRGQRVGQHIPHEPDAGAHAKGVIGTDA
ncbi:MAG TPA: hypothetical protein VFA18_19205 [Gemmataceae bacterium]|nr:hypothetical protein [Gemmataceae bacterium]